MRFPSIRLLSRCVRPRSIRVVLFSCLALAVLAPPRFVGRVAQAAEQDNVRKAREHFKKGDDAFKANRFDEAYSEFEAGFNMSGRPLFLLNMAHVERRRGDLKKARGQYKRYLLMEPESKFRAEVDQVLQEIEVALAADDPSAKPAPILVPPPATPPPLFAPAAPVAPAHPPALSPPSASPPLPLTPAAAPPPPPEPPPESGTSTVPLIGTAARAEDLPSEPEDKPAWKRWPLWAGVGVVVVGGVVAAILLSQPKYTKDGSIGTIPSR